MEDVLIVWVMLEKCLLLRLLWPLRLVRLVLLVLQGLRRRGVLIVLHEVIAIPIVPLLLLLLLVLLLIRLVPLVLPVRWQYMTSKAHWKFNHGMSYDTGIVPTQHQNSCNTAPSHHEHSSSTVPVNPQHYIMDRRSGKHEHIAAQLRSTETMPG